MSGATTTGDDPSVGAEESHQNEIWDLKVENNKLKEELGKKDFQIIKLTRQLKEKDNSIPEQTKGEDISQTDGSLKIAQPCITEEEKEEETIDTVINLINTVAGDGGTKDDEVLESDHGKFYIKGRIEDLEKINRDLQSSINELNKHIEVLNGDIVGKDNYYKELVEEYHKMRKRISKDSGCPPSNSKTSSLLSFHGMESGESSEQDESSSRSPKRMLSRQNSFNRSFDMRVLLDEAKNMIYRIKYFYQSEGCLLEDVQEFSPSFTSSPCYPRRISRSKSTPLQPPCDLVDVQENEVLDDSISASDPSLHPRRLSRVRSRADTPLQTAYDNLLLFEQKVDELGKLRNGYVSMDRGLDSESFQGYTSQGSILSAAENTEPEISSPALANGNCVYLRGLSKSVIAEVEQILENSDKWKDVYQKLIVKDFICGETSDFHVCEFSGSCKLGNKILELISTNLQLTLHDIYTIAARLSYNSICDAINKPHIDRSWSIYQLPTADRLQLQRRFGELHYDNGRCWKAITLVLGLSQETIKELYTNSLPWFEPSYFEQIINLVKKRKQLSLTLQDIVDILTELCVCPEITAKLSHLINEKKAEQECKKRYSSSFSCSSRESLIEDDINYGFSSGDDVFGLRL